MERVSGFVDIEFSQYGNAREGEVAYEIENLVANAFISVAKPVHIELIQPIAEHVQYLGAHLRIVKIEVGLAFQEIMQIILAPSRIPSPS